MLEHFWFNVEHGINHVLDINAYDHVLFLVVLTAPYVFANWKRVLLLASTFTLGHTLSLVLAVYGVVKVDGALIEFLIPVTILLVALYNIFFNHKTSKNNTLNIIIASTLFFGLVHGFGFAREFNMMAGKSNDKFMLLTSFALGIEIAQLIIVFIVLFLGYIGQTLFKFSKREWIMVLSAIVVGLTIPMLIESPFLK